MMILHVFLLLLYINLWFEKARVFSRSLTTLLNHQSTSYIGGYTLQLFTIFTTTYVDNKSKVYIRKQYSY